MLVLDEATNQLDAETEEQIMNGIRESDPTLTVIVVAHRPSALVHCSRIYEVSKGAVSQRAGSPASNESTSSPEVLAPS